MVKLISHCMGGTSVYSLHHQVFQSTVTLLTPLFRKCTHRIETWYIYTLNRHIILCLNTSAGGTCTDDQGIWKLHSQGIWKLQWACTKEKRLEIYPSNADQPYFFRGGKQFPFSAFFLTWEKCSWHASKMHHHSSQVV